MTTVKELWAASAVQTVVLPSGFRVRGVMPSPSEVVRRKIVPQALRRQVVALAPKLMSELDENEHAALVDARRYQTAAFVREMAPPGTTDEDGWEPVTLSVEDLSGMPPADIEALDDLIMGVATAAMLTAASEAALGIGSPDDLAAVRNREAGDTVDGWAEFRDDGRGADPSAAGADVANPAVRTDRGPKSAGRARPRRRAGATARESGAADGPIASA
jgi:hypothetical protein